MCVTRYSILKVKSILAPIFDVNAVDIPDDISLGNYHRWDSLNHVRIILHIETLLNRSLETEDMLKIVNLKEICNLLNNQTL